MLLDLEIRVLPVVVVLVAMEEVVAMEAIVMDPVVPVLVMGEQVETLGDNPAVLEMPEEVILTQILAVLGLVAAVLVAQGATFLVQFQMVTLKVPLEVVEVGDCGVIIILE